MCSSEDYSEKEVDEEKTNLNISEGPSEGLHIDSTELFKVCIPTETRVVLVIKQDILKSS